MRRCWTRCGSWSGSRDGLAAVGHGLIARGVSAVVAGFAWGGVDGGVVAAACCGPRRKPRPGARRPEAAGLRAAEAAGPRRALTGEPLEPVFLDVAAAQVAGEISPRACTGDRAGGRRAAGGGAGRARVSRWSGNWSLTRGAFDPRSLHTLALHIHTYLDPDGSLDDPRDRDRTTRPHAAAAPGRVRVGARGVDRRMRRTACLRGASTRLAAPTPEVGGVKDRRSAGQRRHDALLDALHPAVPDRIPARRGRDRHHRSSC